MTNDIVFRAPSPALFAASWRFALACTWSVMLRFWQTLLAALRFVLILGYATVALGLTFNESDSLYLNALGILMIFVASSLSRKTK